MTTWQVPWDSSASVCVFRCNSFMGNSAVQKKPISKPRKPHLSGHKSSSSSSSREPQPKRVEEVYGALKQGLEWVLFRCLLWFTYVLYMSSLSHWLHESLLLRMALMKSLYCVQSLFMQFYRVLKDLSFSLSVSEYLEVHQTELDKLTSLMKDMKRNSRLVRHHQVSYTL